MNLVHVQTFSVLKKMESASQSIFVVYRTYKTYQSVN